MIDVIQWRASIGRYNASRRCGMSGTVKFTISQRDLLMYLGMSTTVLVVIMLLIKLCGDVEINPGPVLEVTVLNALKLLEESGFDSSKYWYRLGAHLGVPLEERKRLKKGASDTSDYFEILEEMLDWWITDSLQPTWKALISSVEGCGDSNSANTMKQLLKVHEHCIPSHDQKEGFDDDEHVRTGLCKRLSQVNLVNWRLAGIQLGLTDNELDIIERDAPRVSTTQHCNVAMFLKWLNMATDITSYKEGLVMVATALSAAGDLHHANILYKECGIDPFHNFSDELPSPVVQYCDSIKQKHIQDPVIASDSWPPPVGKDYFGKLSLVEMWKDDNNHNWRLLRGEIDKFQSNKRIITIDDMMQPVFHANTESKTKDECSFRAVIDGPPGIGKTTLCRKLCKIWATGELKHRDYKLVLFCPLRYKKISQAKQIEDLFLYDRPGLSNTVQWMKDNYGKGVLIIFDGWDELSNRDRTHSLAAEIIREEKLYKCTVIVTSRTYASSSLLKLNSINRHIEVLGLDKKDIYACISGILSGQQEKAEKLIKDLKFREDVVTLCYIPFVCSLVTLVFHKKENLPTTLTELYEIFIILTIKKEIERIGGQPEMIDRLDNLPSDIAEPFDLLCKLSYEGLSTETPTVTYSPRAIQQYQSLNYLGLLTCSTLYDECSYQFLHLTIQEFLAALWMSKQDNTEVLFDRHWSASNDHFRMCLRFVAGITHLEHESYHKYFNKTLNCSIRMLPQSCFVRDDFRQSLLLYSNDMLSVSHRASAYDRQAPYNALDIYLVHLLYESQHKALCSTLARSIKNSILHLDSIAGLGRSLFNYMCLSYFLHNADIVWNKLDFGTPKNEEAILLMNNASVRAKNASLSFFMLPIIPTQLGIIRECYIIATKLDYIGPLVKLLSLNLTILHIDNLVISNLSFSDSSKLQTSLQDNTTLEELKFGKIMVPYYHLEFLNGVTMNDMIKSFSVSLSSLNLPKLTGGIIKHLLQYNCTIQELQLDLSGYVCFQDTVFTDINTPLRTLMINGDIPTLTLSVTSLKCLIITSASTLQPLSLHSLFLNNPSLQVLHLEHAQPNVLTELFTIISTNTTLKRIKVSTPLHCSTKEMCLALQDMLLCNKTLEGLKIGCYIPTNHLVIALHGNTTLKELGITLSKESKNIELLSSMLTSIEGLEIKLDGGFIHCTMLQDYNRLCEEVLSLLTNILMSNSVITHLKVGTGSFFYGGIPGEHEHMIAILWKEVLLHRSLQLAHIVHNLVGRKVLKKVQRELIGRRHQLQLGPPPIIYVVF